MHRDGGARVHRVSAGTHANHGARRGVWESGREGRERKTGGMGAYSSTPAGVRAPSREKSSGLLRNSHTSMISPRISSMPATSKKDTCCSFFSSAGCIMTESAARGLSAV